VKKLIALLVLALIVFVIVERQRLFVRDVLASVQRDGAKVDGEQVYININNDVLLENDNPPMLLFMAQKGQPLGVPTKLRCIHWLACLTDADVATTMPLGGTTPVMNAKTVTFRDQDGRRWAVKLR
jgi:hypothetical protein